MPISREQFFLNRNRIRRVVEYMEQHLDEDALRLDRLAEVARLSRYHFERLYLRHVAETPVSTVRRLRLQRARQALLDGRGASISELAVEAGYGSVAAFSRAFARAYQMPPSRVLPASAGLKPVELVELPPVPVVRQVFAGRAAEMYDVGEALTWAVGRSGARRWRHWLVYPDGWADSVRDPDRWVRIWHCVPSQTLPRSVAGADKTCLPPGRYARFVFRGSEPHGVDDLARRVEAETAWRVMEGPILQHYVNVPDLKAPSERIAHLYLPVAL